MSSGYNNFDPSRAGRPGARPSWLRDHFTFASMAKIAVLAALGLDALSNTYDHQRDFPNGHLISVETAAYVAYHTGLDSLHALEHIGYAVINGFAHATNKPALPHLVGSPEIETMCVPASLADKGWDDPRNAKLAAYKNDAEGSVKQLASSVYYANERRNSDASYGIPPVQYLIRDQFNAYNPNLTGAAKTAQSERLVDEVALQVGSGELCPTTYNGYQVTVAPNPTISLQYPQSVSPFSPR